MKNRFSAEKSNLIPSQNSLKNYKSIRLLDVYQDCVIEFQKKPNNLIYTVRKYMEVFFYELNKLDIDWHFKDINFDSSPVLKNFMLNLSRKVFKTTLMTKFYGKRSKALAEDFLEALEQQNKLKLLAKKNTPLDQNLLEIDFNQDSGIIKKKNFTKIRVSADLLRKKSFRKIDKSLVEINTSFKKKKYSKYSSIL